MSEQLPPSEAPPLDDIPPIEPVAETITATSQSAPEPRRTRWVAPAWFLLGVIVGMMGFAAYTVLAAPKPAPMQVAALDSNTMREAARTGVLEAIATLQAGGPQQPSAAQESQEPQTVSKDAFTVRETNRLGPATAKVTVYEFSDFQ